MTGSTRASWAELLRTNQLKPVYHERHGIRALKELGRSYLTITKDVTRVMNRIKALYRSWGIPCTGTSVYAPSHRAEWLAKLVEPGVRVREEYQSMRSAARALAPSHPLHVMPPRITRNSHRPRASDRTMVDTLNHH